MVERQDRELHKSRRRDPYALDYGHWTLIDRDGTEHTGLDLDAIEVYLTDVPRIEVELRRVGPAYVESPDTHRDDLRALVREAGTAGAIKPGETPRDASPTALTARAGRFLRRSTWSISSSGPSRLS